MNPTEFDHKLRTHHRRIVKFLNTLTEARIIEILCDHRRQGPELIPEAHFYRLSTQTAKTMNVTAPWTDFVGSLEQLQIKTGRGAMKFPDLPLAILRHPHNPDQKVWLPLEDLFIIVKDERFLAPMAWTVIFDVWGEETELKTINNLPKPYHREKLRETLGRSMEQRVFRRSRRSPHIHQLSWTQRWF